MLIGYMRISSDSDRQNMNLQKDALLSAGVDERHLFSDKVSGGRGDRPGLAEALAYVKKGDILVVWKLDRLGRSLPHLIEIVGLLKTKGVCFKSLTEGMDTSTPSGEFLFNIFGSLAQFERELIRERVNAGLEAARRRGRFGGRRPVISQEKLKTIMDSLQGGMSKAQACRTFSVKRTTLIEALNRSGWTGPK